MAKPINKLQRSAKGPKVNDPSSIQSNIYNEAVGAQKNMEMGHHLVPILENGVYKTNITTVTPIPSRGVTLAVYNNSNTVGSVTLGMTNTITALGVGVTDSNGNVGIACKPNDWTYIATYDKHYMIGSSANLIVYVVYDETRITSQSVDGTP